MNSQRFKINWKDIVKRYEFDTVMEDTVLLDTIETPIGRCKFIGIPGEKGDKGEDGINGTNGVNGSNGRDGKDGDVQNFTELFIKIQSDIPDELTPVEEIGGWSIRYESFTTSINGILVGYADKIFTLKVDTDNFIDKLYMSYLSFEYDMIPKTFVSTGVEYISVEFDEEEIEMLTSNTYITLNIRWIKS